MSLDSKLRVGIVGLGKMGIMHACLLSTLKKVEVTALCDKNRLIRAIAKQPFRDAVITGDLAAFSDLGLDAVYVLTPIPSHYSIVKQIYEQKIASNVFVEKTLTSSFSDSEKLVALSKQAGGVNMVGYMKRFGVTFNQVKSLLDQRIIGDLESFCAYAFSSDFADVSEGSNLSTARGGVLEDLGSHVVDLAVWLFGDLKIKDATVNSRIASNSEDDVSFHVEGSNGLSGFFDASWRRKGYRMPEFCITVRGPRGTLTASDDTVRLDLNGSEPKYWYRPDMDDNVGYLLGGPEYYREDIHFLECVATGSTAKSDFLGTLKVDFLLDQVRRLCS